jgi:hypothetical protein
MRAGRRECRRSPCPRRSPAQLGLDCGIQPATALMLPRLLRTLKSLGYHIVQVVPTGPGGIFSSLGLHLQARPSALKPFERALHHFVCADMSPVICQNVALQTMMPRKAR